MNSKQDQQTHLFLVRFWSEEVGRVEERNEWSGRVQHVLSGEARTFHDWPALINLLLELSETEALEISSIEDGANEGRGGTS